MQQTHNGKSEMQNNLIIQINRHRICTTVNAAYSIHTSQIASHIHVLGIETVCGCARQNNCVPPHTIW